MDDAAKAALVDNVVAGLPNRTVGERPAPVRVGDRPLAFVEKLDVATQRYHRDAVLGVVLAPTPAQ